MVVPKQKKDREQNYIPSEQFGGWIRPNNRKNDGWGNRGSGKGVR